MTVENEQIILAYEMHGMTPEQIAVDRELELIAVKSALMQGSSAYRKAIKAGVPGLDFTDDELVESNKAILAIMRYAEDENLKFRAACYVRDDKKGRHDIVKAMTGLNVNVLLVQEQLQRANTALAKSDSVRAEIEDAKPATLISGLKDRLNRIVDVESATQELQPA
jgi:energy-converting hydrogenase A subunit M